MKLKIFSVFDRKAKAFKTPFFMPNDEVALRAFARAVNEQDHEFHHYCEDFSLFAIGWYDDDSGLIDPFTTIELVANAGSLVNRELTKGCEPGQDSPDETPAETPDETPVED